MAGPDQCGGHIGDSAKYTDATIDPTQPRNMIRRLIKNLMRRGISRSFTLGLLGLKA